MKKIFTLLFVLGLIQMSVQSQNSVHLKVEQNTNIRIDMRALAANTPITIDNGSSVETYIVGTDWTGFNFYNTYSEDFIISGQLERLDISDNSGKIKEVHIDMKNLLFMWTFLNSLENIRFGEDLNLELLSCTDNMIKKLDFSTCPKIRRIFCFGKQFSDCGLDSLFRTLPDRQATTEGLIYIKNKENSNPGTAGCNTQIANLKKWKTYDYNNSLSSAFEIVNENFTCPNNVSTEEISSTRFSIYPNPVKNVMYIKANCNIKKIEVFNTLGALVYSDKKMFVSEASINCQQFDNGVYTVIVTTEKGILIRKILK